MDIIHFIKREPVSVQAFLQTVLAAAVTFGLKLTAEQIAAVLAVSAGFLAFFTRKMVSPTTPKKAPSA